MMVRMNIRKLLPTEVRELQDHLERLDPEDRTRRFMGTVDVGGIRRHCQSLDWLQSILLGYFDAGVLRGVAELQLQDGRPGFTCEVAVTVETQWQGQGIGTELLRRGLLLARNRSAREVQLNCFADNYKIQHIVHKWGVPIHHDLGASDARIPLEPPTYWSLCEEMMGEGMGWLTFWSEGAGRAIAGCGAAATAAATSAGS